jgi:hypothetical protein
LPPYLSLLETHALSTGGFDNGLREHFERVEEMIKQAVTVVLHQGKIRQVAESTTS